MQVGGIEPDVGEPAVVEPAPPKGPDRLVETGTDAADLGFGDPRLRTHGLDEVVDGPGRDPVDVGLHDDGVEGLVDAPALPPIPLVVSTRLRCPLRSLVRSSVRS